MSGESDVSGGFPLSAIVAVIAVTTGTPLSFLHILDDVAAVGGVVTKAVVIEPRMTAIVADSTRRFNMVQERKKWRGVKRIGGFRLKLKCPQNLTIPHTSQSPHYFFDNNT